MKLTPGRPAKEHEQEKSIVTHEGGRDPWGLEEKYFHSLGAVLCEEGRFQEAEEALRRALLYEDTPYARYDLSMALAGRGQIDDALDEISRAIVLAPEVADYYYERSLLRRAAGDPEGASSDLGKAISLDGNYGRIEELRAAILTVRNTFDDTEMVERLSEAPIKNRELRLLADQVARSLRSDHEALTRSSCPVAGCPAYCCHFTGPMVRHGVVIGAWKLRAIKEYLRENSLSFDQFVDRLPFYGEAHVRELVPPPFFIKEGEGHSVFFPGRSDSFIERALLRDLPPGPDYRTLMWINESARPCMFLSQKKCMVHDAGDEAGLPACKQFLCLTGTALVILAHMGIAGAASFEGMTIGELNKIAVESFLILSREIHGRSEVVALRKARDEGLKSAVRSDRAGDGPAVAADIGRCRTLIDQYNEILQLRKESARAAIENLFPRTGSGR
ncbi:MAG TPA: tetratricopeptide repeat protein [Syntrophorhabdaceae bacterium]|jgi:hypothetical protein